MADVSPLPLPVPERAAPLIGRLDHHLTAAIDAGRLQSDTRHHQALAHLRENLSAVTLSLEASLPAMVSLQARSGEQVAQYFTEAEAQLAETTQVVPARGPALPVALALAGAAAVVAGLIWPGAAVAAAAIAILVFGGAAASAVLREKVHCREVARFQQVLDDGLNGIRAARQVAQASADESLATLTHSFVRFKQATEQALDAAEQQKLAAQAVAQTWADEHRRAVGQQVADEVKRVLGDSVGTAEIEAFALVPANHDAFASALTRILPAYTTFRWGAPSTYKKYFLEWQQAGFTVYPNHYYSPVPDLARLTDAQISRRAGMTGLKFDTQAMLALADTFHQKFASEYAAFGTTGPNEQGRFFLGNGVFERIDAEVLHSMIRHHGPRRVIEIGSGYSSLITAAACELNRAEGRPGELSLIEPFPNDLFLRTIPGVTQLLRQGVEECPLQLFEDLEPGDILFIDSSHVIRCGNDVEYVYFEVIPRLRPGVIVHIHDIFLPFRYPASWVKKEHIFWNEQYLVEAMLMHNPSFKVLWAGCHVHTEHPERLERAFPGYDPKKCLPGSLWLVRQ